MASEKNKRADNAEGVETRNNQHVLERLESNSGSTLSPSAALKTQDQKKRRFVTFRERMENSTVKESDKTPGTLTSEIPPENESIKGASRAYNGQSNGHSVSASDFQTPKINELPSTPPQQDNNANDNEGDNASVGKTEEKSMKKKMSIYSTGSQRDGAGPAMFQDFTIDGPVSVDELENKTSSVKHKWNFSITKSIPTMPMSVAITCLILNIVLPGSGTIISGFASLCLCQNHHQSEDKVMLAAINVFVGIAQMSTIFFLLIGWMWSLLWGFALVGLATRYRKLSPDNVSSTEHKTKDAVDV